MGYLFRACRVLISLQSFSIGHFLDFHVLVVVNVHVIFTLPRRCECRGVARPRPPCEHYAGSRNIVFALPGHEISIISTVCIHRPL